MKNKELTITEFRKFANKSKYGELSALGNLKEISSQPINYYCDHEGIEVEVVGSSITHLAIEPKISFLMTSWNRRELLEIAVNSILNLDYSNVEIVIVDDGSTDSTDTYIDSIKNSEIIDVKFIKTNGGNGPGINKRLGFEYVTGKYVVFMDDDDYYINNGWLKYAVSKFNEFPNLSSVYFNSFKLFEKSSSLEFPETFRMNFNGIVSSEQMLKKLMKSITKPNSTFPAIFEVSKLIHAGVNDMKILNDTSIYLRGAIAGDTYVSDDVVGIYRIHSGTMSKCLSIDYILDNVNEKLKLSEKLPIHFKKNEWVYQQSIVTIFHYIQESNYIDWNKLVKWTNNLSTGYQIKVLLKMPIERLRYYKKFIIKVD